MKQIAVSIVFPCRDEKTAVASCVEEARAIFATHHIEGEIIVADSSHDGSAAIATKAGAAVVPHGKDGYGTALREGIARARGEIIIYADADGTYDLSAIPPLLKTLERADIAIGSRLGGTIASGAMPLLHRYLGTPVLNLLLFLFFGVRTSDSQSGFRALKRSTYDMLALKTSGMEFATEMLIKAKQKHLTYAEVPIAYRARRGTSKLRPYRDGFAHLKYIALQAPLSVYFVTGGVLLALGALGLSLGEAGGTFLNAATVKILFPLAGVQMFFVGLFAKTYLHTRFEEDIPFVRKFYAVFRLKTALATGAVLILIPLALKLLGAEAGAFDALLVSAIAGLQILSNSLVLGALSIK